MRALLILWLPLSVHAWDRRWRHGESGSARDDRTRARVDLDAEGRLWVRGRSVR